VPPTTSVTARLTAAAGLACLVLGLLLLAVGSAVADPADGAAGLDAQGAARVVTTDVTGPITPVIGEHLASVLRDAGDDELVEAVVVRLDTPGGLIDTTRTIAQAFLDAPVPVVVHVAPAGADAGSAGTFITYAAHVAAMAPATTIGAATPVDLEGGEVDGKIVENTVAFAETLAEARDRDVDFAVASVREGTSITSTSALEVGAIDLVADDLDELLAELDGRRVEVRGDEVTLATADAEVVAQDMTGARRLLQLLADPNLAFIFLSIGTLAILYEIANPGLGLGGVIGVTSIVLGMFSLSVLPVNYAGAALLVLAAAMFIAELFIPGIGVGAAGGTASLLLGGLFLFQDRTGIGVDWWVLVPTVIVVLLLSLLAAVAVARSQRLRSTAGSDDLLGRTLTVQGASDGRPRARIGSTFWRVRLADGESGPLRDGDQVTVVARDNLDLVVTLPGSSDEPDETSASRTT
jgi:membrane-bound serine protease (ClpP class)